MADVIIAVIDIVSPGATGTQDYTSPLLAGVTPKAVVIMGSMAPVSTSDATGIVRTLGFAVNGGNTNCFAARSDDNLGSTNSNSRFETSFVIGDDVSGTNIGRATLSAWISGGIRLNWTVVHATPHQFYAIVFGGADVSAYTDVLNLGTSTSLVDVTAPNFAPDLVLFASSHTDNNGAASTRTGHMAFCMGAATATAQRSTAWGEDDFVTSGGFPAMYYSTAYGWCMVNRTTGALAYGLTISAFDSQGFSFTPSGTPSSQRFGYLALRLGGLAVNIGDFTAKLTTGSQVHTGLGFRPQALLTVGMAMTAQDTGVVNVATAAGIGIGFSDVNGSGANSTRINFNADPTDTSQVAFASALLMPSDTTAQASEASLTSFDTDGFTLNYSAVSGNATYAWYIAVEEAAAPPTIVFGKARFFF